MIRALALLVLAAALPAAAVDDGEGAARRRATRPHRLAAAESAPGAVAIAIRHRDGMGVVLHVTGARAYLDAGATDGLAPGQTLRLLRGGAAAASCEVEAVAPSNATCRPEGTVKRGDLFRLGPPPDAPPVKPLPPLVGPEELDRRASALAELPHPKVEAKGAVAVPLEAAPRRGGVALSHALWSSSGSADSSQERLDAAVRGAPAFAGLVLDADVRAVRWTARPGSSRARPRAATQLYVYEAALAQRDPLRAWTGSVGRLLPGVIPGAPTFDGVQVALVPSSRRGELGVFGGLVPDPLDLAPTADRSTAGVYGSLDLGGGALSSRSQARAAVAVSPELGTRFEAEVRSFALIGRTVNVEGVARAGLGGKHEAEHGLDLAQVDVSGRPVPRLALSALFRYAGLEVPDAVAPALHPGHERRVDGSAGWELGPALVSGSGGWGRDLGSGLERWWAGPELAFPRLFGARGGVSLGFAEERGWISGRTAWAHASIRAGQRVRLSGRLSWAEDSRPLGDGDHALGAFAAVSADVTRWLAVNASLLARVGARVGSGEVQDASSGIAARVGIASRF